MQESALKQSRIIWQLAAAPSCDGLIKHMLGDVEISKYGRGQNPVPMYQGSPTRTALLGKTLLFPFNPTINSTLHNGGIECSRATCRRIK